MKKFLIGCIVILAVYLTGRYLYDNSGFYIPVQEELVTTWVKSTGKQLYVQEGENYVPFEIKGVDLGVGIPGHFATDYAITKETYMRWFGYIQEMGANTIRVYTILADDFYEAFYAYNKENSKPLYLLQGVWVNDYVQNSHRDAYSDLFLGNFLKDTQTVVDIIHGNKKLLLGKGTGSGFYKWDVSQWVLGYILGVEWEDVTVAYTDHMQEDKRQYDGKYMYTDEAATPFESMLAQVGDKMIRYETRRYGEQRLVAFSNWPTTDPFEYEAFIKQHFDKFAKVDVEHIKLTESVISGTFASYHVYPYYPDYLSYEDNVEQYSDDTGRINTYRSYLEKLNNHHTMPVIISEFGVPSSRGMAQRDLHTGRNQGGMSEKDQAKALIQCYEDIKAAGLAGSIIFTWQDEWFKRTWNTMHAIDLKKTPYWSDYQTNEQYFGLLSFDPGKEKSICYVDGELSEWRTEDLILDDGNLRLSAKYDEKFIYLLVYQENFNEEEPLYIPIDITPKSGSTYCQGKDLHFDRNVDFLIEINGKANSRVLVQERYEVLRAVFYHNTHKKDPYEYEVPIDTPIFKPINLILQTIKKQEVEKADERHALAEVYETGRLIYGNANPEGEDYNSLADFCFSGDYIELKLPWQLLNFSNPSEMMIHDDYYVQYGVEEIKIKEMYLGVGGKDTAKISLHPVKLEGWGDRITYHERLKPAYYEMQKIWGD